MIPIGFVWPTVSDPFRIFIARPMSTCRGRHTHRLKTLNRGGSARVSCAPGPGTSSPRGGPIAGTYCCMRVLQLVCWYTSPVYECDPFARETASAAHGNAFAGGRASRSACFYYYHEGRARGFAARRRNIPIAAARWGVSRRAVGLPRASGRHQPPRPRWQSSRLWHQQPMSPAAT
jgi:hypothetical protein